jgi:hypothetical protein
MYRTAATLGQKSIILGTAQKNKTEVKNLPDCPNGYILPINLPVPICPA